MAIFERPCLVDIDTQFDFVRPHGALHAPGTEALIPIWKQLTEFGVANRLPMTATVDCHVPNDPEFEEFPPHCVVATPGQLKIPETLTEHHQFIRADKPDVTIDFEAQIIIQKSAIDVFKESPAEMVFSAIHASTFAVYGVYTEYCVRTAVLGLRMRGYPVHVISDAIMAVDPAAGERALTEMANAGASFIHSAAFFDKVRQHSVDRMPS